MTLEKIHRDVYASLKAQWSFLFQMMWEALQAGKLEQAQEYRKKLEEVFVNTADNACELFLKLREAEQSTIAPGA